jgi:hypothetical protein
VIRTRLLRKRYLERGRSYVRRKVCYGRPLPPITNEFSNGLRPRRQMEQLEMRNGLRVRKPFENSLNCATIR